MSNNSKEDQKAYKKARRARDREQSQRLKERFRERNGCSWGTLIALNWICAVIMAIVIAKFALVGEHAVAAWLAGVIFVPWALALLAAWLADRR